MIRPPFAKNISSLVYQSHAQQKLCPSIQVSVSREYHTIHGPFEYHLNLEIENELTPYSWVKKEI